MSYTEIFGFNKKGDAFFIGQTKNSWLGAMAIWKHLEEKHLPSLERKRWHQRDEYVSKISVLSEKINEIWELVNIEKLTKSEKFILEATFDAAIVPKKQIPQLIKHYNNFKVETTLPEQAKRIEEHYKKDEIIAVSFNQTSVNADSWLYHGYDEEKDEPFPYNIFQKDEHFFVK